MPVRTVPPRGHRLRSSRALPRERNIAGVEAMRRRYLMRAVGGAGMLCAFGALRAEQGTHGAPRRVTVTARKFSFSQTQIVAIAGESIHLEIASLDFMRGYAQCSLAAEADVLTGGLGQPLWVELTP